MQPLDLQPVPVIARYRRRDPLDSMIMAPMPAREEGYPWCNDYHHLGLVTRALGGRHSGSVFDELMQDLGQHGQIPDDDRKFLNQMGTGDDGNHAGTSDIVRQSYSFSSVRRGGEPAVESTVRKVVTADGQERTVTRKRLGESVLRVAQSAAGTECALTGPHSESQRDQDPQQHCDDSIKWFEEDFERQRARSRGGSPWPREQQHLEQKKTPQAQADTEAAGDQYARAVHSTEPRQADTSTQADGELDGSSFVPVQPVETDTAGVALVRGVLPELTDTEASALLSKHSGDLKAALREKLSSSL